jgi:ParB/RepB/Spo0J family partition protein
MASTTPKTRPKVVQLSQIRENPSALRNVNKTAEDYLGLVDSIRAKGVLNPVVVREIKDSDGNITYGLIDGLHRFTGALDAGLTEIPANVIEASDAEVLEAQIITNIHKVETRPVEYSKQLMRILAGNPTMTAASLATKLAKSPTWISERLGLIKLEARIAKLVDEDKINLSNAYALAKLPADEQAHFVDRAMTMQPNEFVPTVNTRVKELRDAKRQGRNPNAAEFMPVPHCRKLGEIKTEFEQNEVGPRLVAELGLTTALEGFKTGVAWTLHMDSMSIEADRQKDADRRKKDEEVKAQRKADREAAKANAAAETKADLVTA